MYHESDVGRVRRLILSGKGRFRPNPKQPATKRKLDMLDQMREYCESKVSCGLAWLCVCVVDHDATAHR